jgi:hypothetical protein
MKSFVLFAAVFAMALIAEAKTANAATITETPYFAPILAW